MKSKAGRTPFLLLALVLAAFTLLRAPSLFGEKVLLPLEALQGPSTYSPAQPGVPPVWNPELLDPVVNWEPGRMFLHRELAAGRFPLWNPHQLLGVPDIQPKLAPHLLLKAWVASPRVLAWASLLCALAAALGAFVFFHGALEIEDFPAAAAAALYPFTGFFSLHEGWPEAQQVCWFPWLLWAIHQCARGEGKRSVALLAIFAALVLASGPLDYAGLCFLFSGLFFVGSGLIAQRTGPRKGFPSLGRVASGIVLGFLLAAPAVLPTLDYAATGARLQQRAAGLTERPPGGLASLPLLVLPDFYGTKASDSFFLAPPSVPNLYESPVNAYVGLVAVFLFAALAWRDARRRRLAALFAALALVSLAWSLNLPGLTQLLGLPGLRMLSHNRAFGAGFALLALAALGLESVWRKPMVERRWLLAPAGALFLVAAWAASRALGREPMASEIPAAIRAGAVPWNISGAGDLAVVQSWFARSYSSTLVFGLLGLVVAAVLITKARKEAKLGLAASALLAELLCFSHGRVAQAPRGMYYPPVPALEELKELAQTEPGRVLGVESLPPLLSQVPGLSDARGYDAVDPARAVELLLLAADPSYQGPPYARTQWLRPKIPSPVLDLLNVRYLIYRGKPPAGVRALFESEGYYVLLNPSALPRAFVPERAISADAATAKQGISAPGFDPRKEAYVEGPLPAMSAASGSVRLTRDEPAKIDLEATLGSPGLVVLADRWDKNWHAYIDGREVPLLVTNLALRGVAAPAGRSRIVLRYEPRIFYWSLAISALAALCLGLACALPLRPGRKGWLPR